MKLTRDQVHRLDRFDGRLQPFSTVLDSGYMRTLPSRDTDELLAVYAEAEGKEYDLRRDCGECMLTFVAMMGRAYREARAQYRVEDDLETAKKAKAAKVAKLKDDLEASAAKTARRKGGRV